MILKNPLEQLTDENMYISNTAVIAGLIKDESWKS